MPNAWILSFEQPGGDSWSESDAGDTGARSGVQLEVWKHGTVLKQILMQLETAAQVVAEMAHRRCRLNSE